MTETQEKPIRVGSRKSELALIQTKYVIAQLQKLYPEKCFEIHTMSTIGDRVLNVSLPKIGEKSLFTRDLEDALRNGGVDFVVHSLKDLPTALPSGMAIGAVLEREDSRDALVLNEKYKGNTIDTLPAGCVIGTSSLRRTAQLRRLYPHLEICDIRGNLNTRLAKLDAINSKFAGIILAQAGLLRMGWMNRISQVLEPNHLLYAVGQGALAVECRSNDEKILSMLKSLMCLTTTCRILAERSFLKTLGGGCSAPVAVSTQINNNNDNSRLEKNFYNDDNDNNEVRLDITGAVWSLDGATEIKDSINCCLTIERKRKISEKSERNIIEGKGLIGVDGDDKNDDEKVDDDDDDDESPRKRKKLDDDEEDDKEQKKQGSPKIVNDDKFTQDLIGKAVTSGAGDGIKLPDLQYLINIHGELFKKCPFYAQHQKDRENGNVSTKKDECPLNIPIGQDFMGKCPYVDTSQKVELSEKFGNVCPITGKMGKTTEVKGNNNNNNNPFAQGDTKVIPNTQNQQQKCPFSGKTIIETKKKATTTTTTEELGHKDCPFIQKNIIKMYDYDDEKQKKFIETKHSASIDENTIEINNLNEQLFCGLYRHKIFTHDLFLKCEKLGQKLAEHLICKGALDIMKCAQQEIRDK